MGTTITLTAGATTIVITGDTPYSTCTYDVLDGWYDVDNVDPNMVKRPGAPGAFAPKRTYPGEKAISIEGQFFGASRAAAIEMREDLAALYNEGEPVTMTVADDLRTTSREVSVVTVAFPWTIHPEFNFTIDALAADPRRYAAEITVGTDLAAPGGGLSYPLIYPLDYGTIGVTGRALIANTGKATATLRFAISGGEMPDGFVIVNVSTGERLTYVGPLVTGTTITLDGATRAALINGSGAGGRYLSSPQWFGVPPRSSIEVQFLARGPVTGTPHLDVYTSPAFN